MSNSDALSRTDQILDAALAVFSRYGFKRASMADIAAEAQLSRPLLYLSFQNKADVFVAAARRFARSCSDAGEAAWPAGVPAREGLPALARAQHLPVWRMLQGSPHGAELVEAGGGMLDELHAEAETRLVAFLADRLPPGHDPALPGMISAALYGIKGTAVSEADFEAHVQALARLLPTDAGHETG